jgi:hypothetical protein
MVNDGALGISLSHRDGGDIEVIMARPDAEELLRILNLMLTSQP